jgi:putative restriction endonuclease
VAGQPWTELETKLVLYLYFQLTFGQLDQRNPEVVKLSGLIGRTPSSVAMKLANIASLDPKITGTGRKGLSGASAQDRRIWDAFHADWTGLVSEIEHFLADQDNQSFDGTLREESVPFDFDQYKGQSTKQAIVNIRVGQKFFRSAVLANFEGQCCVTGIAEQSLLIASHIVPWSNDLKNRHNPANGLSLSATFDRAFDKGLMTIDQNLNVVFSSKLLKHENQLTRKYFEPFDGCEILFPIRFLPDPEFLDWHNKSIFERSERAK